MYQAMVLTPATQTFSCEDERKWYLGLLWARYWPGHGGWVNPGCWGGVQFSRRLAIHGRRPPSKRPRLPKRRGSCGPQPLRA